MRTISIFALASVLTTATARPQAVSSTVVTGHVFLDRNGNGRRDAGEPGSRGVAVSNQDQVVLTGADGEYTLSGPGTGVVFVSVPTGYTSITWYSRIAGGSAGRRDPIDFALTSLPAKSQLTFVHASDTHIAEAALPRMTRLRALIDSVRPDFVIITGDLVRDALRVGEAEATGYYEMFQREAAKITQPVYTVPGNHENFGIERDKSGVKADHPLYGRAMYRRFRGPDYYSFNAGGVHFVGVNSVDIDDMWYYGHVDSTQLAWLERDLAVLAPATPVVTFNHIPFFSARESVAGYVDAPPAPSLITVGGKTNYRHTVSNAGAVLARIKGHPYPLALGGHIHTRELLRYEGVETRFETAAAIVGPSGGLGSTLPSGITVYRIIGAKIDSGRFVRLGIDR